MRKQAWQSNVRQMPEVVAEQVALHVVAVVTLADDEGHSKTLSVLPSREAVLIKNCA